MDRKIAGLKDVGSTVRNGGESRHGRSGTPKRTGAFLIVLMGAPNHEVIDSFNCFTMGVAVSNFT